MDDYDEYVRTARMMTKIHAKANKSALQQSDTNEINTKENTNTKENDDIEIKKEDEEYKRELHSSNIKFHFHNSTNLDASMEEENA